MDPRYKQLVKLILHKQAVEATEDGTYNPQGFDLELLELAHALSYQEKEQMAANQKESTVYAQDKDAMELAQATAISLVRLFMEMEAEGRRGDSSVGTAFKINHVIRDAIVSFHIKYK